MMIDALKLTLDWFDELKVLHDDALRTLLQQTHRALLNRELGKADRLIAIALDRFNEVQNRAFIRANGALHD